MNPVILDAPEHERIAYLNAILRDKFDLWVVQDADGKWHEVMSLDKFDTVWQAFEYAFAYGVALISGFGA